MKTLLILIMIFILSGCAEVKPWQKGDLARPCMAFDPMPPNSQFIQHTYQSKEGAYGGYGISAGGCGCN